MRAHPGLFDSRGEFFRHLSADHRPVVEEVVGFVPLFAKLAAKEANKLFIFEHG